MQLTSTAFAPGGMIPDQYGCKGATINPPLHIADVPRTAVSLALIMEDPDVPRHLRPDGMFDHWVIWNMPSTTEDIAEAIGPPEGTEGTNTRGSLGYTGPCPPDQPHRYFFHLFALDQMLDLAPGSTKQDLLAAMQGHILDSTQLMGLYTPRTSSV